MSANQPTSASHNQLDTKAQAWSALFEEPMSDLVKRYTSSVFFDKRLWQADITGSLAHAEMLAAQGIIAAADHESIRKGMAQITQEIESGQFEWKLDLEDVLDDLWQESKRLGPMQRWLLALREVVLARYPGRIVIFVDDLRTQAIVTILEGSRLTSSRRIRT